MKLPQNRLLRTVNKINNSYAPEGFKKLALTLAFNWNIKYAGTTAIGIDKWDTENAVAHLKNRWHVQNHLGGIHATAMATLAESTTGMFFGLHVPDTHLVLLKTLKIDYVSRAQGDLDAVATLTDEQKERIQTTDKGSVVVPVTVTDSEGKAPIHCQAEWAWTRKRSNASKKE